MLPQADAADAFGQNARPMQRIMIIGTTGSGKSTLARELSRRLGLPLTELDNLHWLPGWIEREDADFRPLVEVATSGPRWIVEGGYSEVRDLTWGRADALIWLDYSFPRTAMQLLRRTWGRNLRGELCCNGNRESFLHTIGPDSILLWLLKSYWRNRRKFPVAMANYPHLQPLIFRSPRATAKWLASVPAANSPR